MVCNDIINFTPDKAQSEKQHFCNRLHTGQVLHWAPLVITSWKQEDLGTPKANEGGHKYKLTSGRDMELGSGLGTRLITIDITSHSPLAPIPPRSSPPLPLLPCPFPPPLASYHCPNISQFSFSGRIWGVTHTGALTKTSV